MTKSAPHMHWSSASRTDVGKVRRINEDAVLDLPELGLWMVADGMGGHAAGDLASGTIVSALASIAPPTSLGAHLDEVRRRLQAVNRRLREEARHRGQVIGSTVVVLLIHRDHGVVLWAGDSRAYCYRNGALLQLTRDHSQVQELLSRGLLAPDEVDEHPAANVITHAAGVAEVLELDSELFVLGDDDTFLLCSDGLYRELDDDAITACLDLGDCRRACDALIDAALARGARDNVSAVVVCPSYDTQSTHTQYNPSMRPRRGTQGDRGDPTEYG